MSPSAPSAVRASVPCQACGECVGSPAEKKALRCSACHETTYCSSRCQAADWKRHKPLCSQIKRANDARERTTLSTTPLEERVRVDLAAFEEDVLQEVLVFLRTILRLGRPDDLHTTQTLHLDFDYHPEPTRLRERLRFRAATLLPTAEAIQTAIANGGHAVADVLANGAQSSAAGAPRLEAEIDCVPVAMFWRVFVAGVLRHQQFETYSLKRSRLQPLGRVMKLRPNWETALDKALTGQKRDSPTALLEDVLESEGADGALLLLDRSQKGLVF